MKENLIQQKSFVFAVKVVRLYQQMTTTKKEYVLSKQLLRCGTSIGANVEEAIGGHSRADFISKMTIAYKEARETAYWLRVLRETEYLTQSEFGPLYDDTVELCRIIAAIQKSTKSDSSIRNS